MFNSLNFRNIAYAVIFGVDFSSNPRRIQKCSDALRKNVT